MNHLNRLTLLKLGLVCLCVCTPSPQAGSRDFGKDHKERIIDIPPYQGETYGAKGEPERTPEDHRGRWLSSKTKVIRKGACDPKHHSITL